MSDKYLILLEFKDFVLFGKEHQIIVKSEDDTQICKLNIDKKESVAYEQRRGNVRIANQD